MLNRRDLLRLLPASAFLQANSRGATASEFTRFDSHIHIHQEAPALLSALETTGWQGLDIVVCPAVGNEPFDLDAKLAATRDVVLQGQGTLAWASTFDARDFENPEFVERTIAHLQRTFDEGAIAVKIWKTIGMAIQSKSGAYLLPDDPRLLPIYEAIQNADRTLLAHLAEPDGAWLPLDENNPEYPYYSRNPQWHMLGKAGAPSKEEILAARDRVLAQFPDLRVIGCHLGSHEENLDALSKRLDAFPQFAVDTAARVRYFARGNHEQVKAFLERYQDRVLYGTDFSFRGGDENAAVRSMNARHELDWTFFASEGPMDYEGQPTLGLGLPEPILRKIFRENALRWLPTLNS
ncbi:amidohydrolase family protein [Tautonia marina]|uniref:amidohydrolase family protein n=1 Tax=Tautonia marina TaxID=2653855 RepID=UPI001260F22B|nr:amidohydrolase family protein [Tautonia marina]